MFLGFLVSYNRCHISPGECLPVRDWIRNVAVRIVQLVEHFCQGWFLARFPQQTGQQGKMDMNNSQQYCASDKESKRLIHKQVLIIHGPFKSTHFILERKCHISQILLSFQWDFNKKLQQKCTDIRKTWLETWRYTWFWKDIREECFPFLSQNTWSRNTVYVSVPFSND